jgi:hypothetical protein
VTDEPSIEYLELSNVNRGIVAMTVRGTLSAEDVAGAVVRMQEAIARAKRLRVYYDISQYKGLELAALWEKLKASSLIAGLERVAVVGDKSWAEWWAKVVDPLTPFEIRHFSADRAADACAWIEDGLP